MSKNIVIGVIIILLLVLGGWFILNSKQAVAPAQITTSTDSAQITATEGATITDAVETTVEITSVGFSPKNITIKAGESVAWVNKDTLEHTVDSASHPTHTAYPRFNLGSIKTGEQKSLSFPDTGTFKYHDHLNPTLFGSVTVE